MNCPSYTALSPREQAEYIGRLIIAVQSDNVLYELGGLLIGEAQRDGIYETTRLHEDSAALKDIDSVIENGPGNGQQK